MRPGAFENGFGFGEPELDANSALTELDKGLRSSKLGEQVEAIVRFPALFERYPFPILINSAFLKLADVFRTGSNFLRLWVLRVCQQSERHLDKILNVDEFIRRITSVIYANDPIARALTLRTLGSLSGLIPEKKKVHHSIRVALDSHDTVEVSAAICAASSFAQKSKTFGTTMYMKIAAMVQRLSTPIDLKLKLIPIFQYMHHDVQTASMVRKLCLDLLDNYPSQQFVTTILHTLTKLAAATITDMTEQVSFLLTYMEDSRPQVQMSVLRDLKLLGDKGSHLWEPNQIAFLIDAVTMNNGNDDMEVDSFDPVDAEIRQNALDVLHSVASSSAIVPFVHVSDSSLRRLLDANIHSSDMISALKAIRITTDLAINWKASSQTIHSGINLVDMASSGIESLLTSLCSQTSESLVDEKFRNEVFLDLEKCLTCGVLLTRADISKCEWLCCILIRLFKLPSIAARSKNLIVQAIGSIGSLHIESLIKIMPDIFDILSKMDEATIENENSTVATLVGIIFQAHQGHTLSTKAIDVVNKTMELSDLWLAYRMARNSLRYAQPQIAITALKTMKTKVSSEHFHYWLSALNGVASAEYLLSNSESNPKLIPRVKQAVNLYIRSVATIKAASSPTNSLQFQIEYIRIRSEMLVAFSNFLVSCNTLQLFPPADIASSIATVMRDELLKSGRVVTQLRKSIRDFQGINEMYGRLYQTAFDADNDSLLNIQILQQLCRLVARSIEKQVVSRDHPSCSDDDQSLTFFSEMNYINSGNSWTLILSCKKAIEILESIKSLPTQTVTLRHIQCLREVARFILESPLSYPRFFFQTLQMTRVKIAVSPQPRNIGESVTIMHGNNLALKVEGVIQQNCSKSKNVKSAVFRKPKAIRLTVVSTPLPNPRSHSMDQMKMPQEPMTLVKDITPHRDFFQAQFLLIVAPGGITNLTVDTSLVDFEGRVWMTGPRATLSVRVLDDSSASAKSTTISIPGPAAGPSVRPMNLGPNSTILQPQRY